jgi:mannose-P-dolichol utilization defect protein 1
MEIVCSLNLFAGFVFHSECTGFYIAKLLGVGILLGSIALKLPQILNILLTKNVDGLSEMAFYTEVPMCITTVIYNIHQGNSFSSYGETFAILIQNVILVGLLWRFMKPAPTIHTKMAVVGGWFAIAVCCYQMRPNIHYLIPLSNLPMMIWSRLLQIISNFQRESTGQLSMITTFLMFAGSAARVFTTIQEVGWDLPLLSGFLISTFLSGVLMAQIVFFTYIVKPKATKEPVKETKKEK